jgi:hypothetical protein
MVSGDRQLGSGEELTPSVWYPRLRLALDCETSPVVARPLIRELPSPVRSARYVTERTVTETSVGGPTTYAVASW